MAHILRHIFLPRSAIRGPALFLFTSFSYHVHSWYGSSGLQKAGSDGLSIRGTVAV